MSYINRTYDKTNDIHKLKIQVSNYCSRLMNMTIRAEAAEYEIFYLKKQIRLQGVEN